MNKIIFGLALLCFANVSFGQLGLSGSLAPGALQNFRLNPSLAGYDHHFYMGLGYTNIDVYNSAGDLLGATKRNDDDQLVIDLEELIGSLDSLNNVRSSNEIMSFYFGTRIKNLRLGLYHAFRSELEAEYPKELPELLWFGNGPYVGQTLEIGPKLNYNLYNQVGLHVAYQFGKISLGVNVNKIFGSAYGESKNDLIAITTDTSFYEITAKTDYEILSSSSLSYYDPNTLEIESDRWTDLNFSENSGWSLDVGMSVDVHPKLMLHAFVRDLGYIDYSDRVQRIFSKNEFTYSGALIDEGIFDNESNYNISLDTILEEFEFEAVEADDFRYDLRATWGIGGNYLWGENTHLVFLYSSKKAALSSDDFSMIHLGIHQNFFGFLRANLGYSYKYEEHNLGLGLSIHPGPVDFFLYTDNILNAFESENGQLTALMAGLSLRI